MAKIAFGSENECWNWTGSRRDDRYGQVQVARKNWLVHRLVWTTAYGPIPDGMCICHHCDNLICCNPAHLFLGTNADNSADMVRKNRSAAGNRNPSRLYPARRPRGEQHRRARLTAKQVAQLRQRFAVGENRSRLAKAFGISRTHVYRIARGDNWR